MEARPARSQVLPSLPASPSRRELAALFEVLCQHFLATGCFRELPDIRVLSQLIAQAGPFLFLSLLRLLGGRGAGQHLGQYGGRRSALLGRRRRVGIVERFINRFQASLVAHRLEPRPVIGRYGRIGMLFFHVFGPT